MSKPKFSLKEQQGNKYLHLNGQVVPCAFRTPYMSVHHITGEPVLNFPACGDNCQFFEISQFEVYQDVDTKKNECGVILYCSGSKPRTLMVTQESNNNSSIFKP